MNLKKYLGMLLNVCFLFSIFFCLIFAICSGKVYAQAEVEPWGNITGIRLNGQLMGFETSLRVVDKDWLGIASTAREHQRPKYVRDGNKQIILTSIDSLSFTEIVQDSVAGMANVNVQVSARAQQKMEGAFFCIQLDSQDYSNGNIQTTNSDHKINTISIRQKKDQSYTVNKVSFVSVRRQLELDFSEPTQIIIKHDTSKTGNTLSLYFPIVQGDAESGLTAQKFFSIKASGYVDKKAITLKLDTAKPGRTFAGFGGNFRLQNPKADPQVIDYCLQNLRVAWSRIEMPWRFWQPEKDTDPTANANAGKLAPNVQKAMEMAQRLNKMGIPVILTAWFPPHWAIIGEPNFRHVNGVWGNPLDTANMDAIYKSITDYILYLKNHYGVEIAFFSFNESDLGINIRQTAQEHLALIKGLGAYFVSKGLTTKMLLGDNSDATTFDFIVPAMQDPEARKYIGAISFHSWRGWETPLLQKWANAATNLHAPLLIGEGSIDAAAWNYPAIFEEPIYALQEINLYVRLLAICQPLSILQWQLTADYSPLAGGGIFGNNEPLHPTQRFWNLKQLSSTPAGLMAMPVTCNGPDVSCAALGNNSTGIYALHLVNNGASRQAMLSGIPKKVKSFHVYITDKTNAMKEVSPVNVVNGQIHFNLATTSYTTLISE